MRHLSFCTMMAFVSVKTLFYLFFFLTFTDRLLYVSLIYGYCWKIPPGNTTLIFIFAVERFVQGLREARGFSVNSLHSTLKILVARCLTYMELFERWVQPSWAISTCFPVVFSIFDDNKLNREFYSFKDNLFPFQSSKKRWKSIRWDSGVVRESRFVFSYILVTLETIRNLPDSKLELRLNKELPEVLFCFISSMMDDGWMDDRGDGRWDVLRAFDHVHIVIIVWFWYKKKKSIGWRILISFPY